MKDDPVLVDDSTCPLTCYLCAGTGKIVVDDPVTATCGKCDGKGYYCMKQWASSADRKKTGEEK